MPNDKPLDVIKSDERVTEAMFEAMRAERDRFAFEKTELSQIIGRLKAQVHGEQEAKAALQSKLDATNNAWKSTLLTKDALAQLAQYSPADASVVMSHIARAERAEAELKAARVSYDEAFQEGLETADEVAVRAATKLLMQHLGNIMARLDGDGGHRQAEDETLEVSVSRADAEIVRLQMASDELNRLVAQLKTEAGVLTVARAFVASLSYEERVAFFYEVERGYCGNCGRVLRADETFCSCENEE